ncbi:MAG: UdgX family uracil-DNA binding protein [Candidatus Eremiobacteraeota bacterium]|nr:UdgX family uracil-DNA binding protein [Candidatus Eremiobacteraeota bacterium]
MATKTTAGAAAFLPERRTLDDLRGAAASCEGCGLYAPATQTVFGEGDPHARLVFVGEQPGDREDRTGRPFVGPAGQLLRSSLREAGIDERIVYITNAVKHFSFVERGKRRIHQTPKRIEIRACGPWLENELAAIRPDLVVALGSTAASTLLGTEFRLTKHRGTVVRSPLAERVVATIHPSAILRTIDEATRAAEIERFVADLRFARETLEAQPAD